MSAIWVVVPVRGILAGKSRLGSVLDGDQRAALNRRLLATTLDAVARWQGGLDRCIVVSPCGETPTTGNRRRSSQRRIAATARIGAMLT